MSRELIAKNQETYMQSKRTVFFKALLLFFICGFASVVGADDHPYQEGLRNGRLLPVDMKVELQAIIGLSRVFSASIPNLLS